MKKDKPDELDIIDPVGETVIIGGKAFAVKPLVFKTYRRMVKHLAAAIDIVSEKVPDIDLASAEKGEIGSVIGALFGAGEPVLAMLAEVLGTTPEYLDDSLTLESFSAVVLAIFRQNRLERVLANFRQVAPLLQMK